MTKFAKVMTDWPLTPAQWDMIQNNRTGIVVSRMQALQWHLKPETLSRSPRPPFRSADGSTSLDLPGPGRGR